MNAAENVINKLGGDSVIAAYLGVTRQAVNGWKLRGVIPYSRIAEVQKLAKRRRVELCAEDFMPQSLRAP